MLIAATAGDGRRAVYERSLMEGVYDPPGVIFEPADEHDHPTEHPVAECRQEIGDALCERGGIEPLEAVADESAESTEEPLVERDPDQLTDVQERIDSAEFETLRAVASQLDDVNGNQSAEELRVALHTDVDEGLVAGAFDAVETTDTEDN